MLLLSGWMVPAKLSSLWAPVSSFAKRSVTVSSLGAIMRTDCRVRLAHRKRFTEYQFLFLIGSWRPGFRPSFGCYRTLLPGTSHRIRDRDSQANNGPAPCLFLKFLLENPLYCETVYIHPEGAHAITVHLDEFSKTEHTGY